jgi:arsenate reductase-like glutaredoxin family protein
VSIGSTVDARRNPLRGEAALGVLRGVDQLYVTRGRRVTHLDLRRDRASRTELLTLLLGPTGNLRAPTVRAGRRLVVGFDAATYRELVERRPSSGGAKPTATD